MSSRTRTRLADAIDRVIDHRGKTPKKMRSDWAAEGVQVISAKLVFRGRLNLDRERRFVDEATYQRWMPEPLRHGDVLLTSEAPLGETAFIQSNLPLCLGQRLFALRSNPKFVVPRFLLYYLQSPEGQSMLHERATGSTVAGIRQSALLDTELLLLPLQEQQTVAHTLGSIDDLIENNRRRIEVLEEMAKAIYREWFIHFRFPGHENAAFVASSLGPIPDGWRVITLGDSAKWLSGGTPKTTVPDYWNGTIPWITSGTLTSILLDRSERMITPVGASNGTRIVPRDTLLFVVRGMSLVREFRVGIAERDLAFGQDCKALIAKPGVLPLYLGFAVISMADDIQKMTELAGHGTGKLSTDRLQGIEIPLPPQCTQQGFVDVVTPMRESMTALRLATDRLVEKRDLLLPKLVTGEIDVSALDLDALVEAAS